MSIIRSAQRIDSTVSWQIICSLLQQQLAIDLKIAREVNFLFNPDINEDALPYLWDSDVPASKLQSLIEKLHVADDEEDEDD